MRACIEDDKRHILHFIHSTHGRALNYLSEEFRNDRDIVLSVVNAFGQYSSILEFASDALRNDRDLVLTVIHKNPTILGFASEALRYDKRDN